VTSDHWKLVIIHLLARFCQLRPSDDKNLNPLIWWEQNEAEYPLLALFMKAYAAMQPTSLASERLFNKDGCCTAPRGSL
jgi:hypothetical protein